MRASGVDDCGGLVIGDYSRSSFEFKPGYFCRWPAEDMVGWVTLKTWRDFIRPALDCKTDFCRPEHGRWNAGDFLAWKDSLELGKHAG
jgi:hypothetical protein